ncbi:hypothetical protein ACFE04_031932 [Oxalis oulophora]
MDLSIEPNPNFSEKGLDAHNVHVDGQKILTLVTDSDQLLAKWLLKQVKKVKSNTKLQNTIVVTLSAENIRGPQPADKPYDLLTLSLGSSCFMYKVPEETKYERTMPNRCPKLLQEFLESQKVMVVGLGIEGMAKKLEQVHGIKIANPVDLRYLAKLHGILDNELSGLSVSVLGKRKPEKKKLRWYVSGGGYWGKFSSEKVMYTTAEAYVLFQITSTLIAKKEKRVVEEDCFEDIVYKFCGFWLAIFVVYLFYHYLKYAPGSVSILEFSDTCLSWV